MDISRKRQYRRIQNWARGQHGRDEGCFDNFPDIFSPKIFPPFRTSHLGGAQPRPVCRLGHALATPGPWVGHGWATGGPRVGHGLATPAHLPRACHLAHGCSHWNNPALWDAVGPRLLAACAPHGRRAGRTCKSFVHPHTFPQNLHKSVCK